MAAIASMVIEVAMVVMVAIVAFGHVAM